MLHRFLSALTGTALFLTLAVFARAAFVKLLLGAVRLILDSGTAAYLYQASQAVYKPVPLNDMGGGRGHDWPGRDLDGAGG